MLKIPTKYPALKNPALDEDQNLAQHSDGAPPPPCGEGLGVGVTQKNKVQAMSDNGQCPIWGTPAKRSGHRNRDGVNVISPRAGGEYFIFGTAKAVLLIRGGSVKALLTTWVINQRELGIEWPEITAEIIEQAWQRQPLPMHERADRLLKYLEKKSPFIGSIICFLLNDNEPVYQEMLAWSESTNSKELIIFEEFLAKQGWIEIDKEAKIQRGFHELMLTVAGYAHLAELATKQINSSQGFVAMWFDDSMTGAYEKGIGPGIEDAGYKPLRIDKKDFLNKIDDEIIAEIRRSRFVVSDFTADRGGVYYEAGFAHGLNIPVIFTCREDALNNIHFDTRQFPHIVWKTPDDLRKQLSARIGAVIGDGPNKSPKAE